MSNELMIRDEALMPTTFDGLLKQAQVLVKSGMLPEAVRTPEAAVVIMLKGRELNIPPMQAFASIYVVKGKPTIGAQLMGALILRDGHSYHVEHLSDEGCVITFTRRGGKPYTHKFTIEDATKAGLLANDTWKKYPKAMLFSRCMSAGARIAMPDVLAGMYTPEELTDSVTVDTETGEIVATATVIEGKAETGNGNGHTTETATIPEWTKSVTEREAFKAWREGLTLSDTECKRLAAAYKGKDTPLVLFSEFPGTRQDLQNAIEAQMAREQALQEPEPEQLTM